MKPLLTVGRRVAGETVVVQNASAEESIPGQVYELHIAVDRVTDPQLAAHLLSTELPRRVEGLKILWIEVGDEYIKMQVEGSPFPWALVIRSIPEILSLIGITVLGITVLLVFTTGNKAAAYMGLAGLALTGAMMLYWYIKQWLLSGRRRAEALEHFAKEIVEKLKPKE